MSIPLIISYLPSPAELIPNSPAGWVTAYMATMAFVTAGLLQVWKWQDRKRYRAWLRRMN